MADPTLVVRVAANLSEFKSNLAEGVNQIETYKSALSRASSAFDGSRIVQQASAAATAIQSAGGVTALTSSEMAKANAIFTDAAAKLQLMGQGGTYAAQKFTELAAATHVAEHEHESWVSRIAEGLLLRDAINELISKTKELVLGIPEEAHALNILSLQTQTNVEDLQVLAAATREYGVDGDQLGKALYQLGRRIAGNDESVTTAYHLMGMSIEQVKGLNAMDLFLTTERALGKLQGTVRDTAAADLYGGKLGVSMGAFATGADEAIEKARNLNTIASTESVKALAEYQDAIDRASHSLHAWVMEMEGGSAQGFEVLSKAAANGASKWEILKATIQDALATVTLGHTVTANLTTLLDHLNQTTDENAKATHESAGAHAEATVAMTAQTSAFRFMAALELDSAKPLLSWQTEYLGHLKEIGELNAKNAAGIGVNADQFKRYVEESKKATEADKEWAKQQAAGLMEATKLLDEYNTLRVEHGGTSTDAQIAQIHKWADDLTAKMQKAGSDTTEFYDRLAAVTAEKLNGVRVDWAALGAYSKETLQQNYDKAQATYEAMASSSLHFSSAAIQHFSDLRDAARNALYDVGTVATSSFDKMNQSVMGMATGFDGWNKSIMAVDASLKRVIADQAALDKGNTLDIGTAAQDADIMSLLKEGWSLKNAEAIKLSRQWGFTPQLFDAMGNPESSPSKGERVPGYKDGGPTVEGPAYLHADEYVVPKGGALVSSGGGPSISVTINLSALSPGDARVGEQLRQTVEKVIVDTLKTRVHLGA